MDVGQWKQLFVGCTISLTVTMAGMAYGWSAPTMKRLMRNDSIIPLTEEEGSWIYAAIEIGDLFTPIPAGFLCDKIGRRAVLFSVIPIYIVSWLLVIGTRSVKILLAIRVLLGMAMGVVFSVCPLYLGEISQASIRGFILSLVMIMWYVGINISYCVGPYVSYDSFASIQLSVPIALLLLLPFVPESPYYLLTKNETEYACTALMKLRSARDPNIKTELNDMKECIEIDKSEKMPWSSLVYDPIYRECLLMNSLIACVCFFSGLTIVYSYITEIFTSSGSVTFDPDLCTIFIGFVFQLLSFLVAATIDRMGRRPLLLVSAAGCGVSHFVSGAYFFLARRGVAVKSHGWVLLAAMCAFCIFSVLGVASMLTVYQGEIFPNSIKGIAGGIITMLSCMLSLTAIKMFQVITSNFGMHMSLWSCSFFSLFGGLLMYFYIIETKGKTLAEIQRELKAKHGGRVNTAYAKVNQNIVAADKIILDKEVEMKDV